MRLINVKTFRLEEFPGSHVPPYAILSHTWGPDSEELSSRDIEDGNIDKPGIGSIKFRGCCQLAVKDNLSYAWIDTCCIDKTNLAELSEAINSMFRWYQSAIICYAFLSDVPDDENIYEEGSNFQKSRWFRRGWTLQEILAPKKLRFYGIIALSDTSSAQDAFNGNVAQDWHLFGTKGNMSTTISLITGIPREYLLGVARLHDASVAQRMSWAAHRETKRKEDLAYCLLGIFNITMPMIYGEGCDQAFFRLQEQIMKVTRDDSILAWGLTNGPSSNKTCMATSGRAMAKSPLDFANSGHIIRRDQPSQYTRPVDISGGSIRVYLSLITTLNTQVGLLSCGPENNAQQVVGIPLVELPAGASDEYIRPQKYSSSLYSIAPPENLAKLIQIKLDSQDSASVDSNWGYFHYEEEEFSKIDLKMIEVTPQTCWDKERALIIFPTENGTDTVSRPVLLRLRNDKRDSKDFIIVIRYKDQRLDALAECLVFISSRNTSLEKLSKNLPFMMEKLDGKIRAKNELVSLRVTLERSRFKRQSLFVIRLEKVVDDTFATVDATVELMENNSEQEYSQFSDEREITEREARETKDEIYLHNNNLPNFKRKEENISVKTKALEQTKKAPANEENEYGERRLVITSKQTATEKTLKDTSSKTNTASHFPYSVIDWLKRQPDWSPVDSYHQHMEQLSQMTPGTGDWVLYTNEFQAWRDPLTASSTLLMCGYLGSGKSILTSLIIETIKSEAEVRSDMACVYCYRLEEEDTQSPARIWVTLLAQLLQQSPRVISKKLLSRFNTSLQSSSILRANEYWGLFSSQAETFKTVYLIVDDSNNYFSQDENTLQGFWETLTKLPANVKLLLTFRDRLLATHLRASHYLRITPKESDLVKYVNGWLERDTNLSQLLKESEDRDLVIRKVTSLALGSGMFLLARLHMEDLSKCCTLDSIRDALVRLPINVETAFEDSFKQITKNELFDVYLAKHILTWIVYAKVSLSVGQVLESFAMQYSAGERYRDARPTTKRLISAGAGLIVVNSDIVRLVHDSVKDQLHREKILHENADLQIAKACLICLLRATDDTGVDKQKTLMSYAANYWNSHLGLKYQNADEEAKKLIKDFLHNETKLIRAFKAIPGVLDSELNGMTGIHAAVYFDLRSYVQGLVDSRVNINAQCADGQTALHWAVRLRRGHLLKELLANSADTNIQDKEKNTALHRALMLSETDCVGMVKRLLKSGANPNIPGAKGLTALTSTIKYGPTVIAEMLLKDLKDVDAEIGSGYNSLGEIFHHNHKETILDSSGNRLGQLDHAADEHAKYLINVVLNLGIDLNRPTASGWLPLIHAVQTEQPSRVRPLLERDPSPAKVNQKDPNLQWSPLRWAIDYNNEVDVMRLLIKHGADVNEKDSDGWRPLIAAIKNENSNMKEDKVWLLLRGGAKPDIPDHNNWTALLHAIDGYHKASKDYNSYKNIIWLLISNKADVCIQNNKAFAVAMEHHNHSLAWLLLEHGADPNAADDIGMTPLHRASGSDDVDSVKNVRFLLQSGADASRQDKTWSRTPLHIAVRKSLDKVVVHLASQAEHLEIADSDGHTALMLAVLYPSISIVRILLKNNASCTTRDSNGMTAIQYAASLGFNDALEEMIHSTSNPDDINLKDNMGHSALYHALSNNKADNQTIRILVEGGADIYTEGNRGTMASLMLAAHVGKE